MPFIVTTPAAVDATPAERDWARALSWNPNVLYAEGGEGRSENLETRPPNHWDTHLGQEFICKQVVHVPGLQEKIARLVDGKMEAMKARGEELAPLTKPELADKGASVAARICLESGIERQYLLGAGTHCLPLASRLLFSPRGRDTGCYLVWAEPTLRTSAKCDGALRLGDCTTTGSKRTADGRPSNVDENTWSQLEEARAMYKDMATWEMKNLRVGDLGTMMAILGLGNGVVPFEWPSCRDPKRREKGHKHDKKACADSLGPRRLYDDPEILAKFGLDEVKPTPHRHITEAQLDQIYDASLRRGSGESSWLLYGRHFDANQHAFWDKNQPDPPPINPPATYKARYREVCRSHKHQGSVVTEPGSYAHSRGDPNKSDHLLAPPTRKEDFALFRRASMDYVWKSTFVGYIWKAGRSLLQMVAGGSFGPLPEDDLTTEIPDPIVDPTKSEEVVARLEARKKRQQEYEHAYAIVVQAWSSSVNSRSSIIVIHSGNYEIVCLRHRKSQTLYVSDILHVPFLEAPSYSKVQTGLYIAAVEDTLARNKVDRAHGLVPTWTPPAVPDRPSKRPKVVEQLHGDDANIIRVQACVRDYLVVVRDEIGHPKATYRRVVPTVPGSDRPSQPSQSLILEDVKQLRDEDGLVVLEGQLSLMEDPSLGFINVSAKMAHATGPKVALRDEDLLRSQFNGIPSVHPMFGLFGDASEEGTGQECLWLIQAFTGSSLSKSEEKITKSQRDQFANALKAIHGQGVLMKQIGLSNMVIDNAQKVTIMDFSYASINLDAHKFQKERAEFATLLESITEKNGEDDKLKKSTTPKSGKRSKKLPAGERSKTGRTGGKRSKDLQAGGSSQDIS